MKGTIDVEITSQEKGRFSGTIQDDKDSPFPGPVLRLRGTVTKSRRYTSTARKRGYVSTKSGTASRDHDRIRGTYRDRPGGRGTFELLRPP